MKLSTKLGMGIGVVVVGIIALYYISKSKPKRTKQENVFLIISKGKSTDSDVISTFENAFIEAWANAVEAERLTFDYLGNTYNTKGGKKVTLPK